MEGFIVLETNFDLYAYTGPSPSPRHSRRAIPAVPSRRVCSLVH